MNTIRILGKTFEILWVDEVAEDAIGMCETFRQRITMSKGLPVETEQDTLLHEVIHAVDETMGTSLTEQQVLALASGLIAVLRDNKEFTEYLLNGKPRTSRRSSGVPSRQHRPTPKGNEGRGKGVRKEHRDD